MEALSLPLLALPQVSDKYRTHQLSLGVMYVSVYVYICMCDAFMMYLE